MKCYCHITEIDFKNRGGCLKESLHVSRPQVRPPPQASNEHQRACGLALHQCRLTLMIHTRK